MTSHDHAGTTRLIVLSILVDKFINWGNDFPHSESTWPRSRQFLDTFFAGVPEQDRRKVTHDNAARIFHFAD
jgi:predicted TIM-barrel fold metal-dependent hydrolase